jgi:hypothetical protein
MSEVSSTNNAPDTSPAAATVDPWSMTPAQANEALAQRSARFDAAQASIAEAAQDGRDAEVRLAKLTSDPDWVRKFHAGSRAERAEYQQLTETIAAVTAEDGTSVHVGQVETVEGPYGVRRQDVIGVINDLGKIGIPEEGIIKTLTGNFSPEDIDAAQTELDRLIATPTWRERLLAGDPECRHAFTAWCAVISAGKTI